MTNKVWTQATWLPPYLSLENGLEMPNGKTKIRNGNVLQKELFNFIFI